LTGTCRRMAVQENLTRQAPLQQPPYLLLLRPPADPVPLDGHLMGLVLRSVHSLLEASCPARGVPPLLRLAYRASLRGPERGFHVPHA
jgi:hypothetical protein